jgi:hypothetical protein
VGCHCGSHQYKTLTTRRARAYDYRRQGKAIRNRRLNPLGPWLQSLSPLPAVENCIAEAAAIVADQGKARLGAPQDRITRPPAAGS